MSVPRLRPNQGVRLRISFNPPGTGRAPSQPANSFGVLSPRMDLYASQQGSYWAVCRAEPFFRQAAGGLPTWRLKARLKAYSDS
jgi:hypothetical protein